MTTNATNKKRQFSLLLPISLSLLPALAISADPVFVPGSVDPGQLEKQLQAPVRIDPAPPVAVPKAPTQLQPSNARSIQFDLLSVKITNNTVFDDEELTELYNDLIGTRVSLARIYQLADEITVKYRNAGYVLSQAIVPEQQIVDGTVNIQVVEGFIDQVRFAKDKKRGDILRDYAAEISAESPMTVANLERAMLLMNDLPGISAQSTVVPSETLTGAADLLVTTNYDKLYGTVSLDNRGTRRIGPAQLDLSVNYNFDGGKHNQVGARVVTIGDSDLNLISLNGDIGIGKRGDRVLLTGTAVTTEPDLDFPLDDLESSSNSFELTYSRPVLRGRLRNFSVLGGFRAYNAKSEGGSGAIDTRDKTRQLKLGVSMDKVDSYRGITQFQATVAKGLNGLGSSDNNATNKSRSDGVVDFTKFTFFVSRLQHIGEDWSLLTAVAAQASLDPLLSSEQFGIGGSGFVRAYDGSEEVGDNGIAGKLELRYNLLELGENGLVGTPYVFYDAGSVKRKGENANDQGASDVLHAAGAGIRLSYRKFGGYFEVASPRSGDVAAEEDNDIRLFAGISYNY